MTHSKGKNRPSKIGLQLRDSGRLSLHFPRFLQRLISARTDELCRLGLAQGKGSLAEALIQNKVMCPGAAVRDSEDCITESALHKRKG